MNRRFSFSVNRSARRRIIRPANWQRTVRWSFPLFLLLLGAGSAVAMPIDEYRTRIREAVAQLYELWDSNEVETPSSYALRARVAFGKVRQLVPAEETIDWEGGRVKVNNSWLNEELKTYEQLHIEDEQRGVVLKRASERLLALQDRLDELLKENKGAATTKEQEKARLESILRRQEFGEKPAEKSLWQRFVDWLSNLLPKRNPLEPGQSSWLSIIAMILIFGLTAGLLAYALWKLAPFFDRLRGTGLKLEKREARVVLGERLAPDETAADLLAQAETLARKGELRAAIRKGYIALLCELSDRQVLSLAQHKTNHDYLRMVREKRPLLKEMQKLTASFENHWYGFVPATPDDWANFRSGYQQTLKTASLLSDK
jgi:hypothetical protein